MVPNPASSQLGYEFNPIENPFTPASLRGGDERPDDYNSEKGSDPNFPADLDDPRQVVNKYFSVIKEIVKTTLTSISKISTPTPQSNFKSCYTF